MKNPIFVPFGGPGVPELTTFEHPFCGFSTFLWELSRGFGIDPQKGGQKVGPNGVPGPEAGPMFRSLTIYDYIGPRSQNDHFLDHF